MPLPLIQEHGVVGEGMVLDFDPNTGKLILVGHTKEHDSDHAIMVLDPESGVIELIGTIDSDWEDILASPSLFDPKNNIFWAYFGQNDKRQFFGFDMETGKVKYTIDNLKWLIRDMVFDHLTGLVYAVGYDPVLERIAIYQLDGSKGGLVKEIFSFDDASGGYLYYYPCDMAIDEDERILYFLLEKESGDWEHLIGFNLKNNSVVSQPEFCLTRDDSCPVFIYFGEDYLLK